MLDFRISLPHCQNIPAKPSVTDYDLANFTCESPKLLNAPNCTVKTQHPQCKVMLVEGQSGQVKCGGEGKPTPLAQLYDKAGYPVTMQAAGMTISVVKFCLQNRETAFFLFFSFVILTNTIDFTLYF